MRFTYERLAIREDMSFVWYRSFVAVADFANSIPYFRQLSIDDQVNCHLLLNIVTIFSANYLDTIFRRSHG